MTDKPERTRKQWLGNQTDCDICDWKLDSILNKQWFVDGRMEDGRWAVMCARCFEMYGVGLGLGKGQKYDVVTKLKIEG